MPKSEKIIVSPETAPELLETLIAGLMTDLVVAEYFALYDGGNKIGALMYGFKQDNISLNKISQVLTGRGVLRKVYANMPDRKKTIN